jgi:hypothetical protein
MMQAGKNWLGGDRSAPLDSSPFQPTGDRGLSQRS